MTIRQIAFLFLLFFSGIAFGEPKKVTIGIVKDSYSKSLERIEKIVKSEIIDLIEGEFEVSFYDENELMGDWSPEGLRAVAQKAVDEEEIDLELWLRGGPMIKPMAIAIIFGLIFATLLTLVFVPVLYCLFYQIKPEES